jgi:hypothetical protein
VNGTRLTPHGSRLRLDALLLDAGRLQVRAGLEGDPHSALRGVAGKRPSLRCLGARVSTTS